MKTSKLLFPLPLAVASLLIFSYESNAQSNSPRDGFHGGELYYKSSDSKIEGQCNCEKCRCGCRGGHQCACGALKGPKEMGRRMLERMVGELDLPPEQAYKIEVIHDGFEDQLKTAFDQLMLARQDLESVISSATFNENDIRSKSTAIATAEENLAVIRGQMASQVLSTLTNEQREKAISMRLNAKDHMCH